MKTKNKNILLLAIVGLLLTFGLYSCEDKFLDEEENYLIDSVMHQPKLLIFDEPFSGFDPINDNVIPPSIHTIPSIKGFVVCVFSLGFLHPKIYS